MNDIVHTFLLAGDKFMPEMHLRQRGFTYSACGPFTKNKQRIKKFIRTLENKIYRHMTTISKNVYFDVLNDQYNNTYHKIIKMKPIDVGDDSFAEYNEESNEKNSKFKVNDHDHQKYLCQMIYS